MRIEVVDPSAYTPPYDHALCAALAALGLDVELITSRFLHGEPPALQGYRVRELFYRRAFGAPGSGLRTLTKLALHPAGMVRLRRIARDADIVHFQWLPVQWLDAHLLPRAPLVLTAHDLLPREARPGQVQAQRRLYARVDAVIVHSEFGRRSLVAWGVDPAKVHVIHHGAFEHLAAPAAEAPVLPAELGRAPAAQPTAKAGTAPLPPADAPAPSGRPVVLFFGLVRPYKGVEVLLKAWQILERESQASAAGEAELWVVGRPLMPLEPLRRLAGPSVRFVPRFVSQAELRGVFERADVVVLPYSRTERFDQSGVLATALAFGKPIVLTEVGSFSELAAEGGAELVAPDDPAALGRALANLLADSEARERLADGARAAARRTYSWREAAAETAALYSKLTGIPLEAAGGQPGATANPPQSSPHERS